MLKWIVVRTPTLSEYHVLVKVCMLTLLLPSDRIRADMCVVGHSFVPLDDSGQVHAQGIMPKIRLILQFHWLFITSSLF